MKLTKLFITGFFLCSLNGLAAQSITVEDLINTWDNMTTMVIETAKKMPAENYDFRPNKDIRNFGEQMNHITRSNIGLGYMVFGKMPNFPFNKNKPPKEKEGVIELLENSFAFFKEQLQQFNNTELEKEIKWGNPRNPRTVTKLQGLLMIYSHMQLEYGKITVYARSKGIAPEPSSGWSF